MKPEAAYKMIKVWSLTNATIMVILLLIQCRSLLNVLGTITFDTIPKVSPFNVYRAFRIRLFALSTEVVSKEAR